MKIAVAQINTTVGDFSGNAAKIIDYIGRADKAGANIVVFPELTICGYPPRDLLEKPDFIRNNLAAVDEVAKHTTNVAAVIGFVSINKEKEGRGLFNSAAILYKGKIEFIQHKTLLPEYDVFDEARHFEPAKGCKSYKIFGTKVGLSMCEDIWSFFEYKGRRIYHEDPIAKVVKEGANVVLNLSASPYTIGKNEIRKNLVCSAAKRSGKPVVYCNLVGGNDELVFDGRSFVTDSNGNVVREAKIFEEDMFVVDIDDLKPSEIPQYPEEEEVLKALVLGLKDYLRKCGFEKVVIGLSGGIDSALVAAIATEALGAKKVMGVLMPSPYSSKGSVSDSLELAKNLGITTCTVPIENIYNAYRTDLGYTGNKSDITVAEENIQARIRGNILMAISNREGAIVLSTGNKSELSVGYCTLYGDMAGGFALISDLPKMYVYELANYLNRNKKVIPQAIIDKPPSAELKPDQRDDDSLPPYEILDPIIRAYVEDRLSVEEIVALNFDRDTVMRIIKMIDHNEYKRRQAAPGIKITSKAFGTGRRFPIAWAKQL